MQPWQTFKRPAFSQTTHAWDVADISSSPSAMAFVVMVRLGHAWDVAFSRTRASRNFLRDSTS